MAGGAPPRAAGGDSAAGEGGSGGPEPLLQYAVRLGGGWRAGCLTAPVARSTCRLSRQPHGLRLPGTCHNVMTCAGQAQLARAAAGAFGASPISRWGPNPTGLRLARNLSQRHDLCGPSTASMGPTNAAGFEPRSRSGGDRAPRSRDGRRAVSRGHRTTAEHGGRSGAGWTPIGATERAGPARSPSAWGRHAPMPEPPAGVPSAGRSPSPGPASTARPRCCAGRRRRCSPPMTWPSWVATWPGCGWRSSSPRGPACGWPCWSGAWSVSAGPRARFPLSEVAAVRGPCPGSPGHRRGRAALDRPSRAPRDRARPAGRVESGGHPHDRPQRGRICARCPGGWRRCPRPQTPTPGPS